MTLSTIKNADAYGLEQGDLECIIAALQNEAAVEEALLFGSRAKGTYHSGSDVDIAVKCNKLSLEAIMNISSYLNEETLMPYQFDILDYHSIGNADLTAHIDRVGITIYNKAKL